MDWISIIIAIIGALTGGGIISLFTIRETKKSMKIDNAEKEDNRWSMLVNGLQDQIEKQNERLEKKDSRITELEDTSAMLRQKLDEANTALAKATLMRCSKLGCKTRIPPFGYSELTPEELMLEKNTEQSE